MTQFELPIGQLQRGLGYRPILGAARIKSQFALCKQRPTPGPHGASPFAFRGKPAWQSCCRIDRDVVYHFPGGRQAPTEITKVVPNLTRAIVLEGCGHWTQQERPAEVNQALLEFLEMLPVD